jgi:hypothetical protein
MNVHDFEGSTIVRSHEELLDRLRRVRREQYGAFVLGHDDDGPFLWILVNAERAYLHFLPDDSGDHAGFQSFDEEARGDDALVHFLQPHAGEGASFDMPGHTVVGIEVAYKAAAEFFLNARALPPSVVWHEL